MAQNIRSAALVSIIGSISIAFVTSSHFYSSLFILRIIVTGFIKEAIVIILLLLVNLLQFAWNYLFTDSVDMLLTRKLGSVWSFPTIRERSVHRVRSKTWLFLIHQSRQKAIISLFVVVMLSVGADSACRDNVQLRLLLIINFKLGKSIGFSGNKLRSFSIMHSLILVNEIFFLPF